MDSVIDDRRGVAALIARIQRLQHVFYIDQKRVPCRFFSHGGAPSPPHRSKS